MKNWLDDIHDKLGDFEMKAPDGLWARIDTVPAQGAGVARIRWTRRFAVAGAVAASVLAVALLFRPEAALNPEEYIVSGDSVLRDETFPELVAVSLPFSSDGYHDPQVPLIDDAEPEETAVADSGTDDNERAEAGERVMVPDDPDAAGGYGDEWIADPPKSDRRSVSVGFFNRLGGSRTDLLAFGGPQLAATGMDDSVAWDDGPMLGMMLVNRGVGEARFTHHMPIRVGVSVDWQLDGHWFVESGLTYTRLNSSIRFGDSKNYSSAAQKLDYVGIPLNLKYKAYGTASMGLYASAGVSIDKCVSARHAGSYRFSGTGGSGSVNLGTDRHDELPWQFSANVALGAAYIVSPLVSIYAEPGLSWYPDDGSSLNTIYKERPLNFTMNIGLRFTLAR